MKKFSLFAFAFVAALAMTGCSDDAAGGITENITGNSSTGNGYMAVTINLPSTTSTRASVVGYDDGTDAEYAVNDVTLYVFGGSDIETATLQAIYDLTPKFEKDTNNEQITSTQTITFEATSMVGDNFYPVVILNNNNQIPSLTTNVSTVADLNSTAINTTADAMHANDYFFMSNSPYASVGGGTSAPGASVAITTCPVFTSANIHVDEADAAKDPIVLYVERSVAKVTLSASETATTGSQIATVSVDGWLLDNTNNYTYLVRNVDCGTDAIPSWWNYISTQAETTEYRFIDGDALKTNVAAYRTYFGIDPNYNVEHSDDYFDASVTEGSTFLPVSTTDNANPQYCLENTFDVLRMLEQNTTRAVIKTHLTVKDANDKETSGAFYMVNNNENNIYSANDIVTYIQGEVLTYIKGIFSTYVASGEATVDNVQVNINAPTAGGEATVTITPVNFSTFTYNTGHNYSQLTLAIQEWIDGTYLPNNTFNYYADGVAYYRIKIKHFGDTDTPWDALDADGTNSYPGATQAAYEADWLGRYGVLRNNWYDISVTGFTNIGSPTVPEVKTNTDFDDTTDDYIAVEINVLPWAKRTQSEEL